MQYLLYLMCLFFLTSCSSNPPTPPVVNPTITDPMSFLEEHKPDGTVIQANDTVPYWNVDFGGFQGIVASLQSDNSVVLDWQFYPYDQYNLAVGDGGEKYVLEGDTVRIVETKDGGTPTNQYFTGKACGGTGWILFRTDADNTWKSVVARLGISSDPNVCVDGSYAYTEYTRQTVNFPVIGPTDTIVSRHYDSISKNTSSHVEVFFMGRDRSRIAWMRFGVERPIVDLTSRCPDFGWNTSPISGWYLEDCRINVNPVADSTQASISSFWH